MKCDKGSKKMSCEIKNYDYCEIIFLNDVLRECRGGVVQQAVQWFGDHPYCPSGRSFHLKD